MLGREEGSGCVDGLKSADNLSHSQNCNFRFFELAQLDPSITRRSQVTIKVWTKRQDTWRLLFEEIIDLRFLKWLGKMQDVHFPPNCLVFHLSDGIYTLELSNKYPAPKRTPPLPTSSYNALMKLATLDNSIQDALATQETIANQINEIINRSSSVGCVSEAEEKAKLASKHLAQQKRAVEATRKKKEELQASIAARRAAIEAGKSVQDKVSTVIENATEKLCASKQLVTAAKESIRGQQRRICEDLALIYNISPVPNGAPLQFQICGVPLPNTTHDNVKFNGCASEDVLSAALGHVAMLTNSLQYYLGVALPYPVTPLGSRSSIRDDISTLPDPQREFPLYLPKGGSSAQFRFDYGWFLLNKDIEALCAAQGLKVVDIRHTLPNLKYLLYVCSAGTDELPERKRGGVRGLWAGGRMLKGGLGPTGGDRADNKNDSRRGSHESEASSRHHEDVTLGIKDPRSNGNGNGMAVGSFPPTAGSLEDDGEMKLTLRTKGMRENRVK